MKLFRLNFNFFFLCSLATFGVWSAAFAQNDDDFQKYMKELGRISNYTIPRASVASISSGFGASGKQSYIAVSYNTRDTQTAGNDDDGSIAIGYGLGDPNSTLGLELTMAITSVSTGLWGDGRFADEGNFSAKIHKRVAPLGFGTAASLAFGASNFSGWGGTRDMPINYNLSYTAIGYFGSYNQFGYNFTAGVGSAVAGVESESAAYFGIGVGMGNFSTSLAYNGDEVNAGITYFMPQIDGASFGIILGDITELSARKRTIITVAKSW